jgi:hypothetical protein
MRALVGPVVGQILSKLRNAHSHEFLENHVSCSAAVSRAYTCPVKPALAQLHKSVGIVTVVETFHAHLKHLKLSWLPPPQGLDSSYCPQITTMAQEKEAAMLQMYGIHLLSSS